MSMEICQIPGGAEQAKGWVEAGPAAMAVGISIALALVIVYLFRLIIKQSEAREIALNKNIDAKDKENNEIQLKYEAMMREQLKSYAVMNQGYENVISKLSILPENIRGILMKDMHVVKDELLRRMEELPTKNFEKIHPAIKENLNDLEKSLKQ